MSWCDKLASTPAVGLQLNPHFASSDSILSGMSSLLDPLYRGNKPRFNITHQSSFDVQWGTEDGYHYLIDPTKLSVTFRHRMRARNVSGGPPIMEMLSKPAPYTAILKDVSKRLVEAAALIPGAKSRKILRVGVVSTTSIGQDELPPGVARFIEYAGRPWEGELEHYSLNITAKIGHGQGYYDRCIHQITKPEDQEQLLTLNFDWQRLFTSEHPNRADGLTEVLDRAQRSALRYFEDLAEGRRFDEELIRESASI